MDFVFPAPLGDLEAERVAWRIQECPHCNTVIDVLTLRMYEIHRTGDELYVNGAIVPGGKVEFLKRIARDPVVKKRAMEDFVTLKEMVELIRLLALFSIKYASDVNDFEHIASLISDICERAEVILKYPSNDGGDSDIPF